MVGRFAAPTDLAHPTPTEELMADKTVYTLKSPGGKTYKTTDRVEVTNLQARGYKVMKPTTKSDK